MNIFESRGHVLAAEAQERVLDKQIELAKLQSAEMKAALVKCLDACEAMYSGLNDAEWDGIALQSFKDAKLEAERVLK